MNKTVVMIGQHFGRWVAVHHCSGSRVDCECTQCGSPKRIATTWLLKGGGPCKTCEPPHRRKLPEQDYTRLRTTKTMAGRFDRLMKLEEAGVRLSEYQELFCELYIRRGQASVQRALRGRSPKYSRQTVARRCTNA